MAWLHRAIVCSSFGEGLVRVLCIELSSYRRLAFRSAHRVLLYLYCLELVGFSHHYTYSYLLCGVWSEVDRFSYLISHF
jgi:hypothetical protein